MQMEQLTTQREQKVVSEEEEEEDINDFMTKHIITPKKVQLFNIAPNSPEDVFSLLKEFFLTKIVAFLVILLIFYRFVNDGLFGFIPTILCIFLIVIQDKYYKSQYFKILFLSIAILSILKEIQNLLRIIFNKDENKNVLKLTIFLGNHHEYLYELCILMTLIKVMHYVATQGLFCSRNIKHYDDIYRTFFSLKPSVITKLRSKSDSDQQCHGASD